MSHKRTRSQVQGLFAGWSGPETQAGAEVVGAAQYLLAAGHGHARLHADALADLELVLDSGADLGNDARGFMAQHHGLVHLEGANLAVLRSK